MAVLLAVAALHLRVRHADDEVDEVGKPLDETRECPDHDVDPLRGAQQAEGAQHASAGDAEPGLVRVALARRYVRNPVRDHLRCRTRDLVGSLEQLNSKFAHDDQAFAALGHPRHDLPLRFRRVLQDGVQRCDRWLAQRGEKVEDTRAVGPVEDPVLVLDRDEPDIADVDELGCAPVVGVHPPGGPRSGRARAARRSSRRPSSRGPSRARSRPLRSRRRSGRA